MKIYFTTGFHIIMKNLGATTTHIYIKFIIHFLVYQILLRDCMESLDIQTDTACHCIITCFEGVPNVKIWLIADLFFLNPPWYPPIISFTCGVIHVKRMFWRILNKVDTIFSCNYINELSLEGAVTLNLNCGTGYMLIFNMCLAKSMILIMCT